MYLRSEEEAIYLPKLLWWPSPNFSARTDRVGLLVRHEFEGGYEPSVNWFLMKESQVSAHFVAKQHGGTREVANKPGPVHLLNHRPAARTGKS
ncbi:MAG: hypothetical protein WCF81_00615 [Roseiarcus sp.]